MKVKVDKHKADVYAEQGIKGQAGLVEEDVIKKVDKIVNIATTEFSGEQINFNGEMNKEELADIEIEKAQLDMNKQKELKAIDVQVEEELDSQEKRRKEEREEEKRTLHQKIAQEADPDQKQRLMDELAQTDKRIQREIIEEQKNQDKILEERRRRKADRMAIRKMRIEHDQLEDVLTKELQMNNNKFQAQVQTMTDTSNDLMNKEIKTFLNPDHKNKEQALLLIDEINDKLLDRTLKMLQSKQFFDLSKHLQCL